MNIMNFSRSEINQLANLLNLRVSRTADPDDNDGNENKTKTKTFISPGDFGPPRKKLDQPKEKSADESKGTKDIWDADEVQEEEKSDTYCLELKPEYEMYLRQHVTSEDVFLQMGNKSPGSASCECLIVKIKLPNTSMKEDIILDVSEEDLECKTKIYKLKLHLPHKCDPRKSRAAWDHVLHQLTVTLFMVRELDSLNF